MSVNYHRVCRLCMSSRGELLPIFSTTSSEVSDPPVLASKIQACVNVHITEDDELPTRVCRKCLDNVNNWHIFKKVCERSQNKLGTLIKENGSQLEEDVKVKTELTDEAYDDGVVIDSSYPDFEQGATTSKIQPEGPPILASLGLTPRSDKVESDKDEEDDDDEEHMAQQSKKFSSKLPLMPEVSVTVMRPTGETLHSRQGIQQLASKNCLVCGRAYRYSHNARRHELNAHGFDRYTNKITKPPHSHQKLRPNPFNPQARLMPNPINPKIQLLPKGMNKGMQGQKIPQRIAIPRQTRSSVPYPLRIKALKDLQVKKKEPEILKTLLTSRAEVLVSEPEIMNSGPESPETLISEPEIASFQVETILSEPDAYGNEQDGEEGNSIVPDEVDNQTAYENSIIPDEVDNHNAYESVDMESNNEIEIARQPIEEIDEGDAENDPDYNDEDARNEEAEEEHDEEEMEKGEEEDDREVVENGVDENQDEEQQEEDGQGHEEDGPEQGEDDQDQGEQDDDEDLPPMDLNPIVEISEGPQNSYGGEEDEEGEQKEEEQTETDNVKPAKVLDPNKQYLTKTQRDFIEKNRDIIEQINTKTCKCCNNVYSRRKAVIQHLQKNGHTVPKHTCYNCVVTFGHIGALLSHMRANVCTNLWKLIYKEDGIPDDLIIEDEPKGLPNLLNKVQYKDILNARSYACRLCPAKFQLKQFILKHVLDVHEGGQSLLPLECVHCSYRFKENRLWKKHIRNGECTVHIACDLCPEKFITILDFNDHALAVHAGSFDQSSDNVVKNVDDRPTDCPICQKSHNNYTYLIKHLKSVHNEEKPHYCIHCDSKFEHISEINQHLYLEHSDRSHASNSMEPDMSLVKEEVEEYHYSCTECNSIFETVDAWTDHQVAEHNQIAHHCDQCEKKFLRPSELAEHKNTHLRVRFYSCSVCNNSYSTPQKLSKHVQDAHPGVETTLRESAEFYCAICIRKFKSRQAYSNHMRIHTRVPTHNRKPGEPKPPMRPIRPYPLAPASGFINFKPNYNIPNAPYSCDICGKGFMHKKNIWKHKKVLHADLTGEKMDSEENTMQASTEGEEDYAQDENGSGLSIPQFNSFNFTNYTQPSPAPAQISAPAVPENPQPVNSFGCDICGKRFPVKASLYKHKRAKHGIINPAVGGSGNFDSGSRSSCTICKITFSDKKSYYRHRKNVHKSSIQMCKICGKPLNSTVELYEHLKAAHARELLGYNANQGKMQEQQNDGEFDYGGEEIDADDPGAEYQAQYPCGTCGKQFLGLLALQNHQCLNTQPNENSTYDCEICHKSYTSISALKSHRGWHLRSPDGKAAANNSGLWMPQHKVTNKISKHEVLEGPVTRYSQSAPAAAAKRRLPPEVEVTVVNPNKKMRSEEIVEMEIAVAPRLGSENDDRYCSICDKEFTKRAAFQRHMDEVHKPNSVFCPVCDKSFTRKSTLLVHMRKHYDNPESSMSTEPQQAPASNEGDIFACDLCGAQYRTNKALKIHRVRHHGEEEDADSDEEAASTAPPAAPGEFTCGQCGDGVASPRDLIAHRAMHATPTKFFCHICKVYFVRAIDLSAHTRARHADNEKVFFPCAMCDRFYMNKKSLQRHIEMSH